MNFDEWKNRLDMEVAILDEVIGLLKKLRDAAAIQSFPGGLCNLDIRKKQPFDSHNWVAGEPAASNKESSMKFEPGMEDCGK
jgi:hypothetical protein